jgi:hypothetical protein
MSTNEPLSGWAIVEMLGHKQLAGQVSEQVLAGAALVRVDVPPTDHRRDVAGFGGSTVETKPGYTKLIGVGSIYCITPCDEQTARRAAQSLERWNDPIPVSLPKLLPAGDAADADFEVGSDDDEPF